MSGRIVVLGSCSVDFTTYAPRLPTKGETIHGTKFSTSFGGKGANQCVAVAKLGGKVHMIGKVGDDEWGHKYIKHLQNVQVNVDKVSLSKSSCTGIAQICVADSGDNQIVIVAGANGEVTPADVRRAENEIRNAGVIVAQLETPLAATAEAFKINKNGIRILNAAPARKDVGDLLANCSILCVNETEASIMTDILVDNVKSAGKAALRLAESGCDIVLVTLGENGVVYTASDKSVIHVPAERVVPVDTTGAGDAFVGALATFLMTHPGQELHQIVGAACSVATNSVTKEGTQSSYPTRLAVFHKKYKYSLVK